MIQALAAALALTSADPLVHAYADLCLTGDSATTEILSRADAAGWRHDGAGMPSVFDAKTERFLVTPAGTLRLGVDQRAFKDEQIIRCAIDTAAADPEVITAMGHMLGFAPALAAPNVADFFGIRDGAGWRDGGKSQAQEVAGFRATGSYYAFIVSRTPNSAAVIGMHYEPLPGKQPKSGQGAKLSGETAARECRAPRPSAGSGRILAGACWRRNRAEDSTRHRDDCCEN